MAVKVISVRICMRKAKQRILTAKEIKGKVAHILLHLAKDMSDLYYNVWYDLFVLWLKN